MQNSRANNRVPDGKTSGGLSDILLGIGLILGAFMLASALPASGWAMGGFLCFFTLGVTLITEGVKKKRRKRPQ